MSCVLITLRSEMSNLVCISLHIPSFLSPEETDSIILNASNPFYYIFGSVLTNVKMKGNSIVHLF